MATAVLQRPKEKIKEQQSGSWSKIFPNEQITETKSSLFVKKLLAIAVSNIAYLRAIFPEHAFGDRSLEGLNLKILKDDAACPGASQVIQWMRGCFDAFDKKYLRTLIIGIYVDANDPDTVIESYTFQFSYKNDGGIDIYRNNEKISGAHSESETRKATIQLLRTIIILTQTLESLPDDVIMTMKLLYYDDVTPADYEPPGFMSAENDSFAFGDEPMTINVGDVATVCVTTSKRQFEMTGGEAVEVQAEEKGETDIGEKEIVTGLDEEIQWQSGKLKEDQTNMSDADTGEEIQIPEKTVKEPSTDAEIPSKSPAKPGMDDNAVDTTGSQASHLSEGGEEYKVRCPCGCNEDDGLMILCAVCKFWQHGVCFLIVDEEDAPEQHVCDVCAKIGEKDKEPTDHYLTELTPIQVQATCLWRRTLVACLDMDRILAPVLAKRLGTETTVAVGLMNRLNKEGFLKAAGKGKKQGKVIDKTKITSVGIPKYMKRLEKPTEEIQKPKEDNKEVSSEVENMETQTELESLAKRTEEMRINSSKGKLSRKKKKLHTEKMMLEEVQKSPRQNETQKRQEEITTQSTDSENAIKRRGRKRAISKRDEDKEFDVCESQHVCNEERPTKGRKASRVTRDIMV